MGGATNKSAAIRAVLAAAKNPLTMEQLQPRVERRLQQVFGQARLYKLLGAMQAAGDIVTAGWGAGRTYAPAMETEK